MPVSETLRPAPEGMLTIRPQPAAFIPGVTARVATNVLVRFASTTARQSASDTSSSGRPTWPTTPPAQLTSTSTRPISCTSAATAAESVTSHSSRSTPWTMNPSAASAAAIAAPIPCAVPVTSATRSGPAMLEPLARLLDARRPHPQHVLVRALVVAAERAVAQQLAHRGGGLRAQRPDVLLGLAPRRLLDAGQPRPGKVLHPRGVAAVGVDRVHHRPRARRRPPVVPAHLRVRLLARPGLDGRPPAAVAAVPVDQQEAPEALLVQRAEDVAQQRAVDLRAHRRAAGIGAEVRRDPVGQRRQHGDAERLGRLLGHALGEDQVHA